ncbi:TRAP transporter small permease subunit [Thalassobaculum sp.]|uniref:TRAP transporter small permease subunit n=1 Tax=Thalassobaculum sp. TaxID=2022740 RepID=UPI0032EAAF33
MKPTLEAGVWPHLIRIARWADAPAVLMGRAVSWLILPLIAIIIVDSVSRKFLRKLPFVIENNLHGYLNSPIFQDAEWHLHTIIFLGALGYAYSRNAHVRLDIFRPRLGVRGRMMVELAGGILLLAPFLVVFSYYSWDFFMSAWLSDENSGPANGIDNRWIIKFFVFLGPVLLLLSGLSMVLRLCARLFGPEELAAAADVDKIADSSFSAFN